MLIEAARRAEAATKEMLARAKDGAASTPDLQRMLEISKSISGLNAAAQAAAAAAIAERRDHGDGGAEVLASSAGLSRRDAHSHIKTAKAIEAAPAVRDAVESGRVSLANARRLADAVAKTSAQDVESDTDLLADAETMQPDQFARKARRWAVERQGDGGESEHARQRARRRLRMWDGDDGMVHLHAEFDAVTGKRIGNRLEAEARRMYQHDKKHPAPGGSHKRTFRQCMADAFDNLAALNSSHSGGSNSGGGKNSDDGGSCPNGGKPFADIAVVWHLNADTEKTVAEIAGGDRLPASVLEELMCNCAVTGLLYDTEGVPLWRGQTKRRATPGQMRALIAKHGGCFHCGAHPAMCQAHHIKPWQHGGPTDISNLVLACWTCHQKIHHHNWHIRTHRGQHTLHPPGPPDHRPARTPGPATTSPPDTTPGHNTTRTPDPSARSGTPAGTSSRSSAGRPRETRPIEHPAARKFDQARPGESTRPKRQAATVASTTNTGASTQEAEPSRPALHEASEAGASPPRRRRGGPSPQHDDRLFALN